MYDLPLNGKLRQFLAAAIVNLITISFGIACGWASPAIPQLLSTESPIGNEPMTLEQTTWIGSLLPVGGFLIVPFCGTLSERLGRKNLALLTGFPHLISWLLILFGSNVYYIYAARLMKGVAGGMTFFIVPTYVSEISSEDIRGVLGGFLSFSANFGVLFAFVVGTLLSYHWFAATCLIFPLAFLTTIWMMPETPVYLMRRNRQIQARKALMFLRGDNKHLVERELAVLQQQVNDSSSSASNTIGLRDFFKDRATRKGLIISIGLLAAQQFSGIFAMLSYAETIFQRAGSSVSSATAPMIIGAIQLFGAYISAILMDRAGRRLLTLFSCFGMTLSHLSMGSFFYLQLNGQDVSSITWLPVVALSAYVITYVLGVGGVPFVVVSEVFRSDVTSLATSLCFFIFWAMSFSAIQIFGISMEFLGADGTFFMLAICCAISFVFAYCLLLETKGRTREDIVNELGGIGRGSLAKNDA